MKFLDFSIFISALLLTNALHAAQTTLKINDSNDPNGPYVIKMIELANEQIGNKYKLVVARDNISQARVIDQVSLKYLDIFWNSSNRELEEQFIPIRIPLYKGLLGYRIFIINKDNQEKFNAIKTLEDLKKITIGQGKTWADTKILEHNGLNVVKVNKYESLFYMIDGGRFDAFSRGVHEPFGELDKRPALTNLVVEKNIMLVYKMPFYLFVARDNKQLAQDLELGLNRAIADGSFNKVFINDPSVQSVLEKASMKSRRIFELQNPTLSKDTPLDRQELWYDPKVVP